jgi:hypothetical protein
MPKQLEILLSRTGKAIKGNTIDYGEWDVAQGTEKTLYLRNPNPHVKADITKIANKDRRVSIIKDSNIIAPNDTTTIKISIPPQSFETLDEEVAYFTDILDSLSGQIKFTRP